MKKFLITLSFVAFLSAFTSCSVDDMDEMNDHNINKTNTTDGHFNASNRIINELVVDSSAVSIGLEDIDPPKPPTKP